MLRNDDQLVEVRITVQYWRSRRLDDIREVRVRPRSSQSANEGCREDDVADESKPNEENPDH
jgi:hypothetical protein